MRHETPELVRFSFLIGFLFACCLAVVLGSAAHCQEIPDAPAPKFFAPHPRPDRPAKFLDRETAIEIALSGSALAWDAYSTTHLPKGRHELNPILGRSPSNGRTAVYFSSAFAGEIGSIYLARRHKWLKRAIPLAVTAVEVSYAAHNMGLGRPRQAASGHK